MNIIAILLVACISALKVIYEIPLLFQCYVGTYYIFLQCNFKTVNYNELNLGAVFVIFTYFIFLIILLCFSKTLIHAK